MIDLVVSGLDRTMQNLDLGRRLAAEYHVRRRRRHNLLRGAFKRFDEKLLLPMQRWGEACGCPNCSILSTAIREFRQASTGVRL
jgi:hypothetical protein